MKNRKEIWYSLKYFSLQLISLNTVSKAITTNLNICWIIWSASAVGWTAEGGQKVLPSVTHLHSGGFGAPPVTLQKICGRNIREKVQPEIEDWDPGAAGTELMSPDSVFRMRQSPRDVSPVINPQRAFSPRSRTTLCSTGWGPPQGCGVTHPLSCLPTSAAREGRARSLHKVLHVKKRFLSASLSLSPTTLPGTKRLRHKNTIHKEIFLYQSDIPCRRRKLVA